MFDAGRRQWLRGIAALTGGIIMTGTSGCAMAGTSTEKVDHELALEVGKGVPKVANIRYRYGELGWRERAVMAFPGSGSRVSSTMVVPDDFEISWETQEGKRYDFKVPVRSKLPSGIKGKTVLFVIMQDHVEGYVVTPLPNFQEKRERFY
jgi:hypothetical protein